MAKVIPTQIHSTVSKKVYIFIHRCSLCMSELAHYNQQVLTPPQHRCMLCRYYSNHQSHKLTPFLEAFYSNIKSYLEFLTKEI